MSMFNDFHHFRREVDNMFRDFDRQFYGGGMWDEFNDPFFNTPPSLSSDKENQQLLGGGFEKNNQLQQSGGSQQLTSNQLKPSDTRLSAPSSRSGWLSTPHIQMPQAQCKIDIVEEKNKYLVHAELPGMKKEDIKLDLNGNNLTISAQHKEAFNEEDKDKKYVRRERAYGSVTRSLRLPQDVDISKIDAKYDNGMLNINLPRIEIKQQQPKATSVNIQ